MNLASGVWNAALTQQVGWFLIHSIWIGCIAGVCAWISLAFLRNVTANCRYVVLLTWLAIIPPTAVACAISTRIDRFDESGPVGIATDIPAESLDRTQDLQSTALGALRRPVSESSLRSDRASQSEPSQVSITIPLAQPSRLPTVMPAFVLAWLLSVGALWMRLVVDWLRLGSVVRQSTLADDDLQNRVRAVQQRLLLKRPIRVFQSACTQVPTTLGFLRPIILLPIGCVANLSVPELEAILAHEIAHIRRFDFAVNIAQTLVETTLFFHPAVWWLGRQIRQEREYACDDLAVQAMGDRMQYARALAAVATHAKQIPLAMTASSGDLLARVRRIVGAQPDRSRRAVPIWSIGVLAGCLIVLFFAISIDHTTAANAEAIAPQATRGTFEPISGVILGTDGKPLADAVVVLRRRLFRGEREADLAETKTDQQGRFEFSAIAKPDLGNSPVSAYRHFPLDVIARKPGHSVRWQRILRERPDIKMQLKREAAFVGILQDENGEPIPNAFIRVMSMMSLNTLTKIDVPGGHTPDTNGDSYIDLSQTSPMAATTDRDGRFILTELPLRVGLQLQVNDPRLLRTSIYAATTEEELTDIALGASYDSSKVQTSGDLMDRSGLTISHARILRSGDKFQLMRGLHARVRVVDDETGEPVAGAIVNLAFDVADSRQTTSEDGAVEFFQIPRASQFTFTVDAPTSSDWLSVNSTADVSTTEALNVAHEIRLPRGTVISGIVLDEATQQGVAKAEVQIPSTGNPALTTGTTLQDLRAASDANGNLRFVVPPAMLSGGEARLTKTPSGYQKLANRQAGIPIPTPGETPDEYRIALSELKAGEPFVFHLKQLPSLNFRFIDTNERPVGVSVSARLWLSGNRYRERTYEVAASETFNGAVLLLEAEQAKELQLQVFSHDKTLAAFHSSTDLAANQAMSIVKMEPIASVTGTVTDRSTGHSVAHATVSLGVRLRNGMGHVVGYTRTDDRGRYRFDQLIPSMTYSLGYKANGYAPLNSIHTQFNPMAGKVKNVDTALEPHSLADEGLGRYELPSLDGLQPDQQYQKLASEFEVANSAYRALLTNPSDAQRTQIVKLREPTQFFAPAFLQLADENQGTDVELKSLVWLCNANLVSGSADQYRLLKTKAADRLLRDYWDRDELAGAVSSVVYASSERYAAAQKLATSPHRVVQGQAHFTAAEMLTQKYRDTRSGQFETLRTDAIEHYKRVIADYADIPHWQFQTLGEAAQRKLFAVEKLILGAIVPELEGVDLDGQAMKLSDFRGQVVVIHYWEGSLHNSSELQFLAEEYDNDRLVILGVNTDSDRAQAAELAKSLPAASRHWHDPQKEIFSRWSGSWPNTHVIGRDGTLIYFGQRYTNISLEAALDRALQAK